MSYERGDVVWYPALFADYDRPFLLISGDDHPFHGEEYVGVAITTTALDAAIPIDDDDWLLGELPKRSFVKPWNPAIVKSEEICSVAGILHEPFVDRTVDRLVTICGL